MLMLLVGRRCWPAQSRSRNLDSRFVATYIGNASARMRVEKRGGDPRRFRLGDEKEGAGAADAVIYLGTMGVE